MLNSNFRFVISSKELSREPNSALGFNKKGKKKPKSTRSKKIKKLSALTNYQQRRNKKWKSDNELKTSRTIVNIKKHTTENRTGVRRFLPDVNGVIADNTCIYTYVYVYTKREREVGRKEEIQEGEIVFDTSFSLTFLSRSFFLWTNVLSFLGW